MLLESRATLRPPPGCEIVAGRDGAPRSSPAFGASNLAWESTVDRGPEEFAVKSVVRESSGTFPAADYSRYQKDASDALAAVEREIVLAKPAR